MAARKICNGDVIQCKTLRLGKSVRTKIFDILRSDKPFWMETWVRDHDSAIK